MATNLGRYEIRKELGRGGMATVYLGYDPQFKREVAVKVLPPQFTHDPAFFSRFEQEAETIAGLEHTAIVPVYDYGRDGDHPYFVMRLMAGGDLRAAIQAGALPLPRVLAISQRICSALDKAHGRGIVHRDIKPSNILFDDDGYAYLADFGIVRLAEMTHTVTMIGTPEYMTPEQIRGEGVDGRSDIYQMAVVVYEMLTGRQPFTGENTAALLYKHAHEPAPPLRNWNADLPSACEDVIQQALAKSPADRFATAGALAAALAQAFAAPDVAVKTAVPPPPPRQPQPEPEPQPAPESTPDPVTTPAAASRRPPQRDAVEPPPVEPHTPPAALPTTAAPPLLTGQDGRGLGFWILGNALGWTIGLFVAQLILSYAANHGYYSFFVTAVALAIIGLGWGAGQWLALRAYWPVGHQWIWWTAVAFWIPGLFGSLIGISNVYVTAVSLLLDLAMGLGVGGAHWRLLRHRLSSAWVWIPAAMVGLLLNRWLSTFWYNMVGTDYWSYGLPINVSGIVLNFLNGALWAVVTGVVLVWLVGRARQGKGQAL